MGAYENPQVLLDTQTPKYFQQLQDTISSSFANVAQSYAAKQNALKKEKEENKKILKANDMKAQEYAFSLYSDISKSGAGDITVNWAKTFDPLIQESVSLRTGLMNGTIEDKQGAVRKLAQIQSSVDGVTGSLANLSAAGTTYKNALEKGVAVQGGLSSWNDPKITSALDVLTQRLPGNKEPFFKDNDPNQLMWRVMDVNGVVLHEFDADQLNKITTGQGLIKTIPNQVEAFDTLKTTNSGIFQVAPAKVGDKEAPIPTGRVTDAFLKPDQKEVVVAESNGKRITKLVQEVDFDLIKKNGNLMTTLQSQAEGLLANQTSAIDFYNDIISDEKGAWKGTGFNFDPKKPLDEEGKKKFADDYKEYFIQTQIAKTQDVLKPDSTLFTSTYDLIPSKSKKEKTTIGGVKPTAAEKSQTALNARIKEVIDTGEGGVVKGGYTLMKMNGRWGVYDKDGLPKPGTENITNPTILSTHIGGTLKRKQKKGVQLP